MKKLLTAALVLLAAPGCASLADSVASHAVDATGSVAGGAIEKSGDRATDAAIDHAASSHDDSQPASAQVKRSVTHLSAGDLLVKDGDTFVVGTMLGKASPDGSAQVLVIADGRKLNTKDFVQVRAASKTELSVGADVYYTADDDVRRGRWAKGAITDVSHLSGNHLDVGVARDLDLTAQIAVAR